MFYLKLFFAGNLDKVIDVANIYVFHGDLEKIIEVTYSYREIEGGFLLNETLFEEYLWHTYPDNDIDYLWRKYRYKMQVQIVMIDDLLKKTKKINISSRSEWLRKGIFVDALEYVKNILEISLLGLDFEMQKAGYPYWLTPVNTRKRISNIEKKEKLAFGPKIIESTQEFSFCYNFIVRNHETKWKKLWEKDQKSMKKYLKLIKKSAKCSLLDTPKIQKKNLRADFLKKEILRKDYRKIFDMVCELYKLPQRTKLTNAGSIYDGDNFLEIPRDEVFASFSIQRLLKLLTHEIESHYINAYNGKILLGEFRGSKNLPKEEWLAMFMERIFHGYTHENIDSIVESYFTIMAWECLEGEKFEDFMRIMGREYSCKESFRNSVIRAKRNYSPAHVWVQHKDVVYFRGLMDVLKFLKEWKQFSKLFLGKVWFHDVENLYNIYSNHEEKNDVVFPIFISDLIYYYISHKQENKDFVFSIPEYYLYLKKKYWFVDIETFHIVNHIEKDIKKIQKILNILERILL